MTDSASFTAEGKDLTFPLVEATEGNSGYNISSLLKETGNVTYDVGFGNTAACRSDITYIDGDEGILRYRGYPIDQLAEKSSFVEVAYLLIYGELPTASELEDFEERIRRHTMLHEDLKAFFNGFPRDAHPMPVLSSAVSALAPSTRTASTPSTPSRSRSARSVCSRSCRPSRRTRTRSRSASPSSTRTTRSRTPRTSCG
jgi:citrate synthase